MRRQALTDGSGWFDLDSAERFDEATIWDGRNRISLATGSQWDHEALYRTANGRWVKHWWSQWQGTVAEAAAWLVQNGYDPAETGLADQAQALEV
jgi:hypothetical protein